MIRRMRHFQRSEAGQITVLMLFASIVVVWLLGFVVNTARQTTRKIEMQGAADAAAMAGGVWMARGMNMMTLSNKGMADLLSVMITVHALLETSRAMQKVLPPIYTALYLASEVPGAFALAMQLEREHWVFYLELESVMQSLDYSMSDRAVGEGWSLMRGLDNVNQTLKTAVPGVALIEANNYAQRNGADATPPAWIFSGQADSLPGFPVGRGGHEKLARQAECCSLPELLWPTRGALEAWCSVATASICISPFLAWPILDLAIQHNVDALAGNTKSAKQNGRVTPGELKKLKNENGKTLQDMLDEHNAANQGDPNDPNRKPQKPVDVNDIFRQSRGMDFVLGAPLEWAYDPPEPMLLTDKPQREPDAEVDDPEAEIDLIAVSRLLRYLAVARGQMQPPLIGAGRFVNPAPYNWLTYGEADVYNPNEWNMFDQHWRTKLSRASLLDTKWQEMATKLGFAPGEGSDLSLVNLH